MKCSACQENECDLLYENNYLCNEKTNICACTCQVSKSETIGTAVLSVGVGIVTAYGGYYVLVSRGSSQKAIMFGSVLIGAGSSLVLHPIRKKMSGEHMTAKDTAIDMFVNGVKGVSNSKSVEKKFWNDVAMGAAFGAGSRTLFDLCSKMNGEKVTLKSYFKSVGIDVLFGSLNAIVTYAVSHIASSQQLIIM